MEVVQKIALLIFVNNFQSSAAIFLKVIWKSMQIAVDLILRQISFFCCIIIV